MALSSAELRAQVSLANHDIEEAQAFLRSALQKIEHGRMHYGQVSEKLTHAFPAVPTANQMQHLVEQALQQGNAAISNGDSYSATL